LFFIKIFERFRVGKLETPDMKLWLPLCCLPLFSILVVMQIALESVSDDSPRTVLSIASIIAFFFLNVVIFALVEALIRRAEKDKQLAALEKQNAVQREHITLLTENRAQIRRLMHDFKLHIQGFLSLCEAGQYEALADNIRQVAQMQNKASPVVSTGNPAFDAIVSAKREEAEKHGIACKWDIQVPEKLEILSLDTCVLIGNALDNAIEACLRVNTNRFIDIEMETNRTRLLCTIRNTLGRRPKVDGEFLQTVKTDAVGHGIGLRSMKRCCDSLGGVMKWEFTETVFTVLVSLPLKPK
jgi:sensor histidine kinase YesM